MVMKFAILSFKSGSPHLSAFRAVRKRASQHCCASVMFLNQISSANDLVKLCFFPLEQKQLGCVSLPIARELAVGSGPLSG